MAHIIAQARVFELELVRGAAAVDVQVLTQQRLVLDRERRVRILDATLPQRGTQLTQRGERRKTRAVRQSGEEGQVVGVAFRAKGAPKQTVENHEPHVIEDGHSPQGQQVSADVSQGSQCSIGR